MSKRFVFIGGKQIGVNCLAELLKSNLRPELVIANFDDGKDSWHDSLIKFSQKNNLKVIKKKSLKDSSLISKISKINPDIIFCFGATQIIPPEILKIPREGVLNLHPALLPNYKGRYSTVHAIFEGKKITGVTLHKMDNGIDTGPIISQISFPILKTDTAKNVYDNFTVYGTKLFKEFLRSWKKGEKFTTHTQNEKKASYYPKGLPNNGEIDWNWNGEKIYNLIRALTFEPFPPASFNIGKKKMVIIEEKYFKGYK